MKSAKGMATAEMSSAETMAEEVMSPIVGTVVTKITTPDVPIVKSTHNPVSSASAEQKDGGSSYQNVYFPHVSSLFELLPDLEIGSPIEFLFLLGR